MDESCHKELSTLEVLFLILFRTPNSVYVTFGLSLALNKALVGTFT